MGGQSLRAKTAYQGKPFLINSVANRTYALYPKPDEFGIGR